MNNITALPGKPLPYGATITHNGVNFSIFSRNGTQVILALFSHEDDAEPYFEYSLDPLLNKTGDVWHVELKDLRPGALYLYRVDGPFEPEKGHRFNKNIYVLDPYAKALTDCSAFKSGRTALTPPADKFDIQFGRKFDARGFPKCIVIDDDDFDWEGDRPLNYPMQNSVLYETHLKGFTAVADVAHPGTYSGVIEKIPYLKKLGVTSVEFLPIQEFDEFENSNCNPRTEEPLKNYWGYSTIAFFAPKTSYASDRSSGGAVREFKRMVKEMHKAGLEVILDIVFNHTAEGNEKGPTLSFRGLDNSVYYILETHKMQHYKNFSGCGNTFNCNHPVARTFIIDCLLYWVCSMHVDGFRFDLGSILGRDKEGNLMENPPILERIAEEPALRHTKIIAEAWDAGGAYQVGGFPGGRWAEWNDRFRDDMRKFWRGDDNLSSAVATRLTGSSDLYLRDGRKPFHSVNFITSHDGFTMNDLVSYNGKHNEENGENNHDGSDNNFSFNYGFEGPALNKKIEKMRVRQIKNMMTSLILSQGTPMILGGDECRRTQMGNNNAYCQDTPISWFDWSLPEKNADLFRFVRLLIAFRRAHPAFRRPEFFEGQDHSFDMLPDIVWFDEKGGVPDWSLDNHFLAFCLDGNRAEIFADRDDNDFCMMFNSSNKDITVRIPPASRNKKWYRAVDTSIEPPNDMPPPGEEEILVRQTVYVLPAHSCALLMSK
ncbi:MAG: glycogen debranching protein GlgX [Bacteroides sp.]|nr:glycogen debranching protein GlgX [Prevotella sp.]MCM1406935.1 glycogen debranching protein GlgX [Treponema brennaborense]MCM1470086.1 glycogen debranching protein GlgX [Bacteroides sp.]